MKRKINYIRFLGIILLMVAAKNISAQGCTFTINATPSMYGYYGFWASSTTTLAGNSTYDWDFGDGNTSSNSGLYQMGASNTYTANGTYTVTFTYSNSATSCSFTSTHTLAVTTASCTISIGMNFTSALSTFTFVSTSTGTTPTTTYNWNFGDGNSGTGQTVVHTYTSNGNFTPALTVGEPASPACNVTSNVYVSVCTQTASIASTTYANGLVSFTCTSALTNTSTNYYWSFGEGSSFYWGQGTSSTSHNYIADGTYSVSLMIQNSTCTLTVPYIQTVSNVTSPCGITANFYNSMPSNNVVTFTNTTTNTVPGTTYIWSFGDGNTSTADSPTHAYAGAGTYTVSLFADNNFSYTCTDTQTLLLVIPNCTYTPSFTTSLGANGSVFFSSNASPSNSTSTTWYFGDGSGSVQSPSATHSYTANGSYTVTIVGSSYLFNYFNNAICTNTLTTVITITNVCTADASFSIVPTATAQVWDVVPASPGNVSSAVWNWGDGSTSNVLFTSHSYSAAGIYTLCLTVTTSCGAVDSYCSGYSIYKSANGNEDLSMIELNVVEYSTVGIKKQNENNVILAIAPNPNRGIFRINMSGLNSNHALIEVYNVMGQRVYETQTDVLNGSIKKDLQLEDVENGVYFLKVSTDKQTTTKKIVIAKS